MTRRLAAVLALSLLGAPAAYAGGGSDWHGDCGFDTISQETVTGTDHFAGVLYGVVGLYSRGDGNVVNATVTCDVRVNGVVRASASRWGSGVVAVADRIDYVATDVDEVELCTTVDFTSDDTPTSTDCGGTTYYQVPPQDVIDLFTYVFDWLAYLAYVDPTVCPVIQQLAPGAPPTVTIDEQGDIYVAGEFFWDCAPYSNGSPPPDGPPPLTPPYLPEPFVPTGAGYNTGTAGFLALTAPGSDVTSACGYVTDPATGAITVTGLTTTAGASSSSIRCRLEDTATGTVLFDGTTARTDDHVTLLGSVPPNAGPVTVCTEGSGQWSDRTVTVGLTCRPGEPLDRVLP